MRKLVLAAVVFALPHVCFAGKVPSDWTSLKMLQPGQKVRIIETNHKKESGRFVSLSDEAITLREKPGNESIARTSVLEVDVSGHRLKHTLIGMAIGGGAGVITGAAAFGPTPCRPSPPGSLFSGCFDFDILNRGTGAAIFGAIGAIAGSVVGALLPAHKAVYRAQ